MINYKLLIISFLLLQSKALAFERLDPQYQIRYGSDTAKIKVYEYFSFGCFNCLGFMEDEFPEIRDKYIKTDKVLWIFHPDPSDRLTVQALICLQKLNDREKCLFLETVAKMFKEHGSRGGVTKKAEIMRLTMESLGHPIADLEEDGFIKKSTALKDAYKYLDQEGGVVTHVPTIEINDKIYKQYPTQRFIEKTLDKLLEPLPLKPELKKLKESSCQT